MLSTQRTVLLVAGLFALVILLLRPVKIQRSPSREYAAFAPFVDSDVSNRTLGFARILVINLPERTDRRDAMTLAASLTGLDVDWIEGWSGHDVHEKALPPDSWGRPMAYDNRGSWRAHMDALRRVVETGLNTALIVEDDADWDVRLKTQMPTLARATRGYVQPLVHDTSQTLVNVTTSLGIPVLSIGELPDTLGPERSPYGDGWDVLWLGHCGTESPGSHESTWTATEEPPSSTLSSRPTPTPEWPPPLQITLPNDTTVPGPEHLKPHPFALPDPLGTLFPAHTRVVHAAGKTMCTQAYAVSQEGARRLLWQFGLETLTAGWDLMLRDWCADTYLGQPGASPRDHGPGKQRWGKDGKGDLLDAAWKKKRPVCLTVQPPLFSHRFGKGAASDMTAPGGGFVGKDKEMTPYIRLSVRMNLGRLVHGASMSELADQWPDDE